MANRASVWSNPDGLVVGFGPRDSEDASASAPSVTGAESEVFVDLDLTALGATAAAQDVANSAIIPAGAVVTDVAVWVDTAAAGTGTLDIGSYNAASGAAVDENGFLAAATVAALVEGADANAAGTYDGALVGTKLAASVKVGASYNTSAFTAGKARVVIKYVGPQA